MLTAEDFGLKGSQKKVFDKIEGIIKVDAGPGTGKTTTMVPRYIRLLEETIDKNGVIHPENVIMLTFTRNAAEEIKNRVSQYSHLLPGFSITTLRANTFDAFCSDILKESPGEISEFFGVDDSLSRNAAVVESDASNQKYFDRILRSFLSTHIGEYKRFEKLAIDNSKSLFELIEKLISYGIFPAKEGWFGSSASRLDADGEIIALLTSDGALESKLRESIDKSDFRERYPGYDLDRLDADQLTRLIDDASPTDPDLSKFLLAVFKEYIRCSIRDSRLTYSLNSLFAFLAVYLNEPLRRSLRCDYMIIDEFQDTNRQQLMLSLMLLRKSNLCVVGDADQSIYGFRNATPEYIVKFEDKVKEILDELGDRCCIEYTKPKDMRLKENYRSSEAIIRLSYDSLQVRTTDKEQAPENIEAKTSSHYRYHEAEGTSTLSFYDLSEFGEGDYEDEAEAVTRIIRDYCCNKCYTLESTEEKRHPEYQDIAVLCRNNKMGRYVLRSARSKGIPAYLDADMELIESEEGLLLLAWLRLAVNTYDRRGLYPILFHHGNTRADFREIRNEKGKTDIAKTIAALPKDVSDLIGRIYLMRDRPEMIVSEVFSRYPDLDQDNILAAKMFVYDAVENGSTITEIIEAIENGGKQTLDPNLEMNAVKIQTIHKSKGLTYPIVIVAGLNTLSFPRTSGDAGTFRYTPGLGMRCMKTIPESDDSDKEVDSSIDKAVMSLAPKQYDEERRLLFVAVSRAKEYVSITAHNPSIFFKDLLNMYPDRAMPLEDLVDTDNIDVPKEKIIVDEEPEWDAESTTRTVGIHTALGINDVELVNDGHREGGRGKEYGIHLHHYAEQYANRNGMPDENGLDPDHTERVRKVIDGLEGYTLYTEMECSIPVSGILGRNPDEGKEIILSGIIDLLAYNEKTGDVQIHDWKTDATEEDFGEGYLAQLTCYALAVSRIAGVDAGSIKCFLQYVNHRDTEKKVVTVDFQEGREVLVRRLEKYLEKH